MNWRYYLIRPIRNGSQHHGSWFYAPDQETAFGLARAFWPMARAWECMTSTAVAS